MLLLLSVPLTKEESKTYEELYNEYGVKMFRVAMKYLNNTLDSQDIVHEVFSDVVPNNLKKLNALDGSSQERFLIIAAKSRALNELRRRRNEKAAMEEYSHDVSVRERITDREMNAMIERLNIQLATFELDENSRDILWLRYAADLSIGKIAKLLKISIPAAQKRLQRARFRLAYILRSKGDEW